MIYLIHPESCSAWTVDSELDADAAIVADPLIERVTQEEFLKACAAWGEDPVEH